MSRVRLVHRWCLLSFGRYVNARDNPSHYINKESIRLLKPSDYGTLAQLSKGTFCGDLETLQVTVHFDLALMLCVGRDLKSFLNVQRCGCR